MASISTSLARTAATSSSSSSAASYRLVARVASGSSSGSHHHHATLSGCSSHHSFSSSSRMSFTPSSSSSSSTTTAAQATHAAMPPPKPNQPSDTSRASAQMRRFWKTVSLHRTPTHYEVKLDNARSLRTPEGKVLTIPLRHGLLARLIVHEWDSQTKLIKSHALPLTSLVARASDGFSDLQTRRKAIEDLLRYAHTDTVCFHESSPKALVRLQKEHWDPLLDWISERFGTRPSTAHDTLSIEQPAALLASLRAHLDTLDALLLASLEKSVHLTKSLFLSLALLEGRLTVLEAMHAAWVETNAQVETWGQVEDSHDVGWAELGRELGAVRLAVVSS